MITFRQTPNQAMQRTASQPAIYLLRVCYPPFGCVVRFTALAFADLVLVRHKGSMNRLIVLVAILALVAGFASAQPGSSNLDTGKELVAQLYKEHSGKSDPLQYPASKKLLPNYFHKPLLDLYLKDQEDSKGEVGKIDFDPLYDAQDFEISDFNLVVLPNRKESRYVAARFKNTGVDQEIIFALERTKMGWRIADIQYKDRRSLWKILKG